MTTLEAVEYMDILMDKYGSPELETDESIMFLNHAVNEYINRLLPDNQGAVVNFEQDANVLSNLQPLIYKISLTPSTGLITNAAINTQLEAQFTGGAYLKVISMGQGTTPIKFMKHNNRFAYARNYFKSVDPRYTVLTGGFQIYPTTFSGVVEMVVIKKPKLMTQAVNPEFGDYQMYTIIAIALQLAGVSVRDDQVIQEVQAISVQGK